MERKITQDLTLDRKNCESCGKYLYVRRAGIRIKKEVGLQDRDKRIIKVRVKDLYAWKL